jgi:hypothetical protein
LAWHRVASDGTYTLDQIRGIPSGRYLLAGSREHQVLADVPVVKPGQANREQRVAIFVDRRHAAAAHSDKQEPAADHRYCRCHDRARYQRPVASHQIAVVGVSW